ncbi:hypothetical protein HanIR_Chr10g0496901 [Helianthus annuus]|nr:hypothetical protein HanIR_Chr10g0496901 [Helianthus annuus]
MHFVWKDVVITDKTLQVTVCVPLEKTDLLDERGCIVFTRYAVLYFCWDLRTWLGLSFSGLGFGNILVYLTDYLIK